MPMAVDPMATAAARTEQVFFMADLQILRRCPDLRYFGRTARSNRRSTIVVSSTARLQGPEG
jgi:hypothetical protein